MQEQVLMASLILNGVLAVVAFYYRGKSSYIRIVLEYISNCFEKERARLLEAQSSADTPNAKPPRASHDQYSTRATELISQIFGLDLEEADHPAIGPADSAKLNRTARRNEILARLESLIKEEEQRIRAANAALEFARVLVGGHRAFLESQVRP